jgi:hypothetical protein
MMCFLHLMTGGSRMLRHREIVKGAVIPFDLRLVVARGLDWKRRLDS